MSAEIKINKLKEAKDWTLWKLQTKVVLRSLDVFKVVDGTEKCPVLKTGASEKEKEAHDIAFGSWEKKDVKAQSVILTSIDVQPSLHIVSCKSANEMWLKLHNVFEQKSETGIHFLQQKFFTFEKNTADDMANFISKLEEIVQQLDDLGEKIPESMVVTKILMALPSTFNHFHSAWESTADDKKSLNELRNRLMIEEKRLISQSEQGDSSAFMARDFKSKRSNKNRLRKCYLCGSTSHLKKDCERRSDVKQKSEALCCDALVAASETDAWYMDSGATEHMANRRELLNDYKEFAVPHPVKIGNGDFVRGVGIGNVDAEVYDGEKWIKKRLINVLYVPSLHANLFSQGRCTDKGFKAVSDSKKCVFLDGKRIVAMGIRETSLYRMLIKTKTYVPKSVSCATVAVKGENICVWHERFAHQNVSHVKKFLVRNGVSFIDDPNFQCEACVVGKHHRLSFKSHNATTTKCGEIVHTDVCGPIQVNSIGGARYFLLLKDGYSHMRFVYFIKAKSEVASKIKSFVEMVNNQTEYKIKTIRSDNGTEFVNSELKMFFENKGIKHELTVAYTPEQNGAIERENRTIVEATRTMLHAKKLNLNLWAEGVNTSVFVLNRTGTSSIKDKSPCELWFNETMKFDYFKVFGSMIYAHIPKQKRQKLDKKAEKLLFVGYSENMKGYRVYDSDSGTVKVVRDVIFEKDASHSNRSKTTNVCNVNNLKEQTETESDENVVRLSFGDSDVFDVVSNESQTETASLSESGTEPVISLSDSDTDSSSGSNSTIVDATESERNFCDLTQSNVLEGRLRSNLQANVVQSCAFLATCDEPYTYEQAIKSENNREWMDAMREEIDSLVKSGTWVLVEAPKDQKIVDNRWVFRIKRNPDNSVDRYKARLVARGFSQTYGVDYTETFSPVVKFVSIRCLLAIAAERKMFIKQFDVKTAFLYGELVESVYMKQPIGFTDKTNRVCKLVKSLYGLKQAPRCWNTKFKQFIVDFEFKETEADSCVFIRKNGGVMTYLAIFVDDGLIISENENQIQPVIEFLQSHFEIKIMDAKYFLGLEINRFTDGSIHLNQQAYIKKVLANFGFEDSTPVSTPADYQQVLQGGEKSVGVTFPYRHVVGSLIYLAIGTRPDISFAVGYVSRFLENPANIHVTAVKRILRYLKRTSDYGILFSSNNVNNFEFCIYSDADYAGCIETRRSTTGYCLLIGSSTISWSSERQSTVSHSTAESEYIAASQASRELVWMKRLLAQLDDKIEIKLPILFVDNESAVKLIKNPVQHKRTKHIEVKYHYVREKHSEKVFVVKGISTENQLADIFTKALPKVRFQILRSKLNVLPIPKN